VKKKILIVDDEEGIHLVFRDELEEVGYEVHSVFSGEEAIRSLKIFTPDLVILDIRMPGEDGRDTLREIKQINKDLNVVLCSADPQLKHDLRAWAADDYIVKSSDSAHMLGVIYGLLGE
jgi:CheY-like chemotaxis protein